MTETKIDAKQRAIFQRRSFLIQEIVKLNSKAITKPLFYYTLVELERIYIHEKCKSAPFLVKVDAI